MADYAGDFVWYDLMTSDPKAAQAFYGEIVGWGTQLFEGGGPVPYTMWTAGGTPLGGVMTLPDEAKKMGAPPHWLGYVGTKDIDATVARAKELGGAVYVEPQDIPTVGRFAVIADPQQAVIAVFQPSGEAPDPGEAGPGKFSWRELYTTDAGAAWAFYEKLFGWNETKSMDMGEMGTYQMYGKGDRTFGGIMKKPADMQGPPAWLYYVTVADLDAVVEQVKSRGGKVWNGPMEVPGDDRIAMCTDPQGAAFALHQSKK